MPDRLLILTVLLTGAAATDLRKGKVYDLWILPAYLAGSLWRIRNRALLHRLMIASGGMVRGESIISSLGPLWLPTSGVFWSGQAVRWQPMIDAFLPGPVPLWQSALHAFFLLPMTVILMLLPLWRWRGLGGGDVRLLAVVSLFLTPAEFLTGLFCAMLLGAGIGIIVLRSAMEHNGIVICDGERSYALRLMEYLKSRIPVYDISAFFSAEKLLASVEPARVALLVIAENAYGSQVREAGFPRIMILNESGVCTERPEKSVSKYQPVEQICEILLHICQEEGRKAGTPAPPSIRHCGPMRMIGVYSPLGRVLQTTVSFGIGELNFSGLDILLNRHFRGSVSDLLYFNECAKEKLAGQLALMVEDIGGLSILPPMHSFMELQSIRADQWQALFRSIEQVTDYEWLILDLSESTAGLLDILRSCSEVITLTQPGCRISAARLPDFRGQDAGIPCHSAGKGVSGCLCQDQAVVPAKIS